jgi:hypothetical protein
MTRPKPIRPARRRVVARLGWRNVSDRLQQAVVVEPVDPFERGELDSFEGSPRPTLMDDLGLVETADRLGQSIVIAVADAADRRFDAWPAVGFSDTRLDCSRIGRQFPASRRGAFDRLGTDAAEMAEATKSRAFSRGSKWRGEGASAMRSVSVTGVWV